MLFWRKHVVSQPTSELHAADAASPARSPSRWRLTLRRATRTPRAPMPIHQRIWREWLMPLAIVAAILTPIRSSIADWNDVPTGSMRPTILEGDRIYVNKLAYGLRIPFTTTWLARWDTPQRGEIVTFKSPADGIRLVKRVIGIPGDRISMQGNRLFINGAASNYHITDRDQQVRLADGRMVNIVLAEEQLADPAGLTTPHALTITPGALSPNTFNEIVVPEGSYFLMGDNRDMSRDSRMIGFVPLRSIYGRSGYVALSVDPENGYLPRFSRWFTPMR